MTMSIEALNAHEATIRFLLATYVDRRKRRLPHTEHTEHRLIEALEALLGKKLIVETPKPAPHQ